MEAQAKCDALTSQLQSLSERRASHSLASLRLIQQGSPGHAHTHSASSPTAEIDSHTLLQKIRAQKEELGSLQEAFDVANMKRGDADRERALLSQRLVDSELRVRRLYHMTVVPGQSYTCCVPACIIHVRWLAHIQVTGSPEHVCVCASDAGA